MLRFKQQLQLTCDEHECKVTTMIDAFIPLAESLEICSISNYLTIEAEYELPTGWTKLHWVVGKHRCPEHEEGKY